MIYNIIDRRKNPYACDKVWGVVEPTWHDNSIDGATQAPVEPGAPSFLDTGPMEYSDLLEWAGDWHAAMTLYVYDSDPMRESEDAA